MSDTSPQDYFKTPEHEARVMAAIERDQARLMSIANADGPFASISDAIGGLTVHTSWFKQIGLKQIAINLLTAELDRLKKS